MSVLQATWLILSLAVLTGALPASSSSNQSAYTQASNGSNLPDVQGWTSQPDGRGTIDIIQSCIFTIFICSWSVLCVNLPAEEDGQMKIVWRKFCLTGLGILGPEFVTQIALGQWISAKRSVQQFRQSGFAPQDWTMNHAFFADMGGIILHTPDWVPFPVNAKQIHYLVERGYLPLPSTTKSDIKDKNKVDALLRVMTVMQALYFLVNSVARLAQNLAMTTFELTTIGFILCTLGTYFCWAHKPADVETPVVLYCKTPIAKILQDAGKLHKGSYNWTPLDFVSRREWSWSLWWIFGTNIVRKMGINMRPQARPIRRIPNDNWLEIPPAGLYALGAFDLLYGAVYLAGWNFWFPTDVERLLWRLSTAGIFGIIASYLVIETYAFYLLPKLPTRWRALFEHDRERGQTRTPGRGTALLDWMRNSSLLKDSDSYAPLKAILPITIIGLLYGLARGYILVECLVALRELPASAYQTVNWSGFLLHV